MRVCRPRGLLLLFALLAVVSARLAIAQAISGISLPTPVRVGNPGWWPTKGEAAREEYVGATECAGCHGSTAASYRNTAMAHAVAHVGDSESLRQHAQLTFQDGPFHYLLETSGDKSGLRVNSEAGAVSADLLWAFGAGRMGQTYLYQQKEDWFESRVSFFSEVQGLDITPGHVRSIPGSLSGALGLKQDPPTEIRRCFGCHTTASATDNHFDPADAVPGVNCEACHGPGALHARAMKAGEASAKQLIFNPAHLDPVEQVDFCGACHRTWQDVVGTGLTGVGMLNVRFAPYRLENSKCWRQQDGRLSCVACHNPHKPLVRDANTYDAVCEQCHVARGMKKTAARAAPACPVATKNCVSCHMQKYTPPNLHSSFTDHWIRIVRSGKPYPD